MNAPKNTISPSMSEQQAKELQHSVGEWEKVLSSHRNRLLNAYYAAKPGRRWRIFRNVRSHMGELAIRIQEAKTALSLRNMEAKS